VLDPLFASFFDESHRAYAETCRRFVEREVAPHAVEWEEAESFPRELYAKAGAAGILGAGFPEAYGGAGGDIFHSLVTIESLLRGGSSGVAAGLGSHGIALPPVLMLGTEAQKTRLVPPVLRGEKVAALAVTEPNTGSDVAGVRTRAERQGDEYVLNGSKLFITNGGRADFVVTLTRTGADPHGGLTFFVVERGTPGFSASRSLKKMGWRASDTAELVFEDCRVPAENRLGAEGTGFLAVMHNFQAERLALAAFGYASAEIALEEAERYARDRRAFGRPLMGFQVTRHKLADMATKVRAAKALTYLVAAAIRRGENVVEAVSSAKNFAGDVALEVCHEAVQILGGMGYMRESVVERLYRDVRLLPIGGGTREIMNEIIGKMRGYSR
jgi:acyl-CoA dehydrogenase